MCASSCKSYRLHEHICSMFMLVLSYTEANPDVVRNESSDILHSDAEVDEQGSGLPDERARTNAEVNEHSSGRPEKRARTWHQQENEPPPRLTLPASSRVRPPLANVFPNSPPRNTCEQDRSKSQASSSRQGHKQSLPSRCVKSQDRTLRVCIHMYR
jgi:hypothetical protein